jgi:hypothetical protein
MDWFQIPNDEDHRLFDGVLMVAAIIKTRKGWYCQAFPPGKPTQIKTETDLTKAKAWAEETLKQTRI